MLVLESYVVGVPEGNMKVSCMFEDTIVQEYEGLLLYVCGHRCAVQSLAKVSEHLEQNQERQGALQALIAHSHLNSSFGLN
ncbi:hypothetical protein SUGI_0823640 [Cryptomeria japonica]|nr:hypothetical protein SUGI_0823640 [Cryptomeria japonica]